MRAILDLVTEQYKAEKQEAYIHMIFTDAIAGMDWDERIKCVRAMMNRIGPYLPEELQDQPPERFARNDETIETIVRTYVRNNDRISQLLAHM